MLARSDSPVSRTAGRRTNRPLTVVALVLALFPAAVEMTVVSTAMPTVVAELGGALHYSWVFSAYMFALTITVPIYGKLADLYGRRPVLFFGMACFLGGSMACGQAHSMTTIIVARVVQGIGAGGLQPITLTIVGDIFDLEQRAKMQGVFGAVWGIAGLVGPLVGGLIVATFSWRWVFYVNVPFGVLSIAILTFSLVESAPRKAPELDLLGAALLSAALITLLLGMEGFESGILLPASALLSAGLVFFELRVKQPMFPPRLFMRRVLAVSSALSVLSGVMMLGIVTFLPLYAQGVIGATPTQAGATVAPMAVGWPIAGTLASRVIPRFGFRALIRTGACLVVLAVSALAFFVARGATGLEVKLCSALFGIGMGLASTTQIIAVQMSVPFEERGVATASITFFRSIGSTVGVGAMGVVLTRTLLAHPAFQGAGGSRLVARLLGPDRLNIPSDVLVGVAGDLQLGVARVTSLCVAIAVLALLAAFSFPSLELRKKATA